MSRLYKMDRTGHGLVKEWDPADKAQVLDAEAAFKSLRKSGFAIALMDGDEGQFLTKFDPNIEEMVAVPALYGG